MRPGLLALAALNLELARAGAITGEPIAGLMRLQWWRDALAGIGEGRVPRHPVAEALAAAIAAHGLPQAELQAMIVARESDLEPASLADWPRFMAYADATAGALVRLGAGVCGVTDTGHPALGAAGRAIAVIGHLRAAPVHAARGRRFLPGPDAAANAEGRRLLAEVDRTWAPHLAPALPAVLPLAIHRMAIAAGREPPRWRRIAAVALATLRGRP